MDRELQSRWIHLPKVEIEDRWLMTVNGKILELPDVTPAMLTDYIEIAQYDIDESLRLQRTERRFQQNPVFQPSILLGRLALVGRQETVLNKEGLDISNERDLDGLHLQKMYRGLWLAVENKLYVPEMHVNLAPGQAAMGGTWLGLSKK